MSDLPVMVAEEIADWARLLTLLAACEALDVDYWLRRELNEATGQAEWRLYHAPFGTHATHRLSKRAAAPTTLEDRA